MPDRLDLLTDSATLADSAASAVRNLNDHEIMGRKLRVDFSNEGGTSSNDDSGPHDRHQSSNAGAYGNNNSSGSNNNNNNPSNNNGADNGGGGPLPQLPPGSALPPGLTVTDHISRTLNTLPPTQLLDILTSVKQLCATDPARATDLFTQAPQLAYAIFQALLLMGLVSPEAINAVLEPGSVPPPVANLNNPAQTAPAPGYPPAPGGGGFPGAATNTPPVAAPGGYAPPPPAAAAAAAPTPLQQQQHMAPPAPAPAAAPPAAPGQDSNALIQQVLSLPDEVIQQLPPAEREQIMALRAQYTGRA